MLEELKQRVFEQNIALVRHGLVVLTWGNVSARDGKTGLIVIKPSGVPYSAMKAEDMVVVDCDGNTVEGDYRPSSDLPTHLYLYKQYSSLGGIVHTHSTYATAFAQSGREIIAYGTTHADAFYGDVPCSRELTDEEIDEAYEWNTGKVIVECVDDVEAVPAILVKNHGVFTWGNTPEKAVENAVTLEEVAKMAYLSEQLNPDVKRVKQHLLDKHYFRKHGKNAYYGQK
ncbi:MAG: L-ribulose-5-phosphate 4-epimerase [Ruminococcaceae bacterium]|nr:L-ribulose-5-phosphate 4-epimerase [Oscillospiraceae bacterium]